MDKLKIYSTLFLLLTFSLSSFAAPTMYFVHSDHNGTPQALTDKDQNVVWKVESQTPFGETVVNEDPDGDGEKLTFNLRFPGQYYDEETETNYNYFRTYDPSLGRYVQSDPIGLDDGPNTYAYTRNNPTNYFDPDGLSRRGGSHSSVSSNLQAILNQRAISLINAIRRIDPSFSYPVATPARPGQPINYPQQSVNQLQTFLRYAQSAGYCGVGAASPVGRSGNPINVVPGPSTLPTTINGVTFSSHAIQRMQGRGIPPTAVLSAVRTGINLPGNRPGTRIHLGPGVSVVTNSSNGNIITVIPNGR